MNPKKSWFARLMSRERRSSGRQRSPTVIAHYWPGAVSSGEVIRDISPMGFYLQTEHQWYPGTVFKIRLQHASEVKKDDEDFVTVLAMVTRIDSAGAGFIFVHPNPDGTMESAGISNETDYRDSLDRFLKKVKQSDTEACFDLE